MDHADDARILAVALTALADRDYDRITVESIAAEAGKAKTTLYRRWPTKAALMLAAVQAIGDPPEFSELPDTGSLRSDLLAIIDSPWLGGLNHRMAIFAGLTFAARTSAELGDTIRTRITDRYVEVYQALLQRGIDRGDLVPIAEDKIRLIAEVIPAMSTHRVASTASIERGHYLSIIDAIILPALSGAGPAD